MSWRDTLTRLVLGDSQVVIHDAVPELQKAHAGFVQRAEQMRRHAETAPNQLNHQELGRLGDEEQAYAQQLLEALTAMGASSTLQAAGTVPDGALNHWGRLVQDLEAHRAAARHLREEAVHFAETLPETAKLLEQLCRAEEAHALRLRDLIARTDPQALN
jgi:hypothetical protein